MQDFGVMMCDIAKILQRHEGALERMLMVFEQMVIPMKSAMYIALINSNEYSSIKSVRALFKLLAPYWKPVHCPLLIALVNATECKAAIQRLQAYLMSRQKVGQNVVLGEEGENVTCHYLMQQVKMLQSLLLSSKNRLQMEVPLMTNPLL